MISFCNAFLILNYIQLVNGNTAMVASLIVLLSGLVGALMGPFGGHMLDKHGARRVILVGVSMMLVQLPCLQ
jgi:nitrate/nitrite transporter NarK